MSDHERQIETKARTLRKYEGDPHAFAPAPGEPGMYLLAAFGPVFVRTAVPQALTDHLNRFADGQARPGEFLVPEDVMTAGDGRSLLQLIEAAVARYAEAVEGQRPVGVQVDVAWVVAQQADTPSPAHFHSCDVSGILY